MANGFDIGQVLSRAAQLTQFFEAIKKRRLERETPLAGALEELTRGQQVLGEREIEEDPELFGQIARRAGVERPEDVAGLRRRFGGMPSPARQQRRRDLAKNITNLFGSFAQQRSQNQALVALMQQQFQDQPELAQLVTGHFARLEQEQFNTSLQAILTAYPDLADDPEISRILAEIRQMSIVGGTAPGLPGAIQQGPQGPGGIPGGIQGPVQ